MAAANGKDFFPAVIAGAGPAGLSTAITLAQRGVPVCIIEPEHTPALKTGEVVSPGISPLLERLGVLHAFENSTHLPCYGFRFRWGSTSPAEKLFIADRRGNGWQIDRLLFENQLREKAAALGVEIRYGQRIRDVQRNGDNWELKISGAETESVLHAAFIADATGRNGSIVRRLAARRMQYDKLVGLSCTFALLPDAVIEHYTQVEAVNNGWWYAVAIPGNRLRAVFMTDADGVDKTWQEPAVFRAQFENTTTGSEWRMHLGETGGAVVTSNAATSALEIPYGAGWLAVGDAAYAFDPVSSYGISSALGSGFYAGNAIADTLVGNADALPAYRFVMEQAFMQYLKMWQQQYEYEQRWPDALFWKRRTAISTAD